MSDRALTIAVLLIAAAVTSQAAPLPAQTTDWRSHGGSDTNHRFAPLRRIHRGNVGRLVLRRAFQTGTARLGGLLATPLVADGVLHMTTPYNSLIAWDLRTGRERWRYEHRLGEFQSCCGPTNRGAALAGDLVLMGTLDARLVALDAGTGAVRWEVEDSDPDSAYAITMAPLVVGGSVIVGASGAEYATRGRLTAYDVRTGQRLWRFHTVPSPDEGGWWGRWSDTTSGGDRLGRDIAQERSDSARYADAWRTGGGTVWTTPAYDAELGLIYFGTGNPVPEYDGSVRPGDNLYTVSLVALDVATGQLRWYHQYVPHDEWDHDVPNPPILFRAGGRKLVAQATKMGWVYVLDATDGSLVRRSAPLVPQESLFARPTAGGIRRAPGAAGGANWQPSALDPVSGTMYVPMLHLPMVFKTFDEPRISGRVYRRGSEDLLPGEPWFGTLSAVELGTGRIAWTVRADSAGFGGALRTAGDLVFAGDGHGWFRAFDARTGAALWEFYCGAGVNAPPVTFELEGEQFVAVAAGGSFYDGKLGDTVLVFGLPQVWRQR